MIKGRWIQAIISGFCLIFFGIGIWFAFQMPARGEAGEPRMIIYSGWTDTERERMLESVENIAKFIRTICEKVNDGLSC